MYVHVQVVTQQNSDSANSRASPSRMAFRAVHVMAKLDKTWFQGSALACSGCRMQSGAGTIMAQGGAHSAAVGFHVDGWWDTAGVGKGKSLFPYKVRHARLRSGRRSVVKKRSTRGRRAGKMESASSYDRRPGISINSVAVEGAAFRQWRALRPAVGGPLGRFSTLPSVLAPAVDCGWLPIGVRHGS